MTMNIVIIGGTGSIGTRLAHRLRNHGHEATAASPSTGVNTVTGEGLQDALEEAEVVIDVSNSPSYDAEAAAAFFEASTTNLLELEALTGIRHHVSLSAVGADRLSGSGYFRAKRAQEELIRQSGVPYSLIRATQVFESSRAIADQGTRERTIRIAPVRCRPVAADDVARTIARIAVGTPTNGLVEVGGPEEFLLDQLIRECLQAWRDPRSVVTDLDATYFGSQLGERTLLPDDGTYLGEITFDEWLAEIESLTGKPPRQFVDVAH